MNKYGYLYIAFQELWSYKSAMFEMRNLYETAAGNYFEYRYVSSMRRYNDSQEKSSGTINE